MGSDGSLDPADRTLRLFVALELPEPVRLATGTWAASALDTTETLRPVRVEGLHVTLCFLGATRGTEIEGIAAGCRRACAGHGPLRLSIGGLLALPRRRPRAVVLGVEDEHPGRLTALQRVLAETLVAGGWYRPESRSFLAHVTVARVRSSARLHARALEEKAQRVPTTFTADVVTLFESRTQPGGAVYQPRARVELAA